MAYTVYECYDGTDQLLYVGVTANIARRIWRHKKTTPWFDQVARIEQSKFMTPDEAAQAETQLIRERLPQYNRDRSGRSSQTWAQNVSPLDLAQIGLRLPHDLHEQLKALAAREHRSLHGQIIHLLRAAMEQQ